MGKIFLVVLSLLMFHFPVLAAEQCWVSSPLIPIENNLEPLDRSDNGDQRCFDKSSMVVSRVGGRTEIMANVYMKVSTKVKIEIAKQGVSCTYDHKHILYSCPSSSLKGCTKHILSWGFLNERYEQTLNFFAEAGIRKPLADEMKDRDYKDYLNLVLTDLLKNVPPQNKSKEPISAPTQNKYDPPKTVPKIYSADEEVDTTR